MKRNSRELWSLYGSMNRLQTLGGKRSSSKTIGMITIGQSPRVDVVPEIKDILGEEIEVLEAGALDGLSLEQVRGFLSPEKGLHPLHPHGRRDRGRHREEVYFAPHAAAYSSTCRKRCGDDPSSLHGEISGIFIEEAPHRTAKDFGSFRPCPSTDRDKGSGLMIPLPDQMEQAKKKYSRMKGEMILQAASPYAKQDEVSKAARALKRATPHVIVMHCMGYTQAMKDQVREITGKPVILARSLVARTLKELIG